MSEKPEKPWDFDDWFQAQHGKRPSNVPSNVLERDMAEARYRLWTLEGKLRSVEEWEARRTSALYAWQIRDAEKRPLPGEAG